MRIRLVIIAVALGLSACQPSDQKAKSVRERLEAGEVVEYTKPGMKTPNCGNTEWTTIKLSAKQERDRVIVGSQYSIINAGYKFCGRIGAKVDMTVFKGDIGLGQVRVQKISLVKLNALRPNMMKGKFFASESDLEFYKKSIKLYPENQGIVTVIDTVYQNGTAVDEKAVREKEQEKNNSDGFEETKNDGDALSQCPSPWNDITVADEFQDAIFKGTLGSWYNMGQKNCMRQGQMINIKSRPGKDEPAKGQMKIVKIKRFRMSFLDGRYFDLRGYDFAKIKANIGLNDKYRDEWITVVDFEPKAAPAIPASEQLTINIRDIKKNQATALVQGESSLVAGDLVTVNVIQANGEIKEARAKVISREFISDVTLVKIELIDGGGK